MLVTPNTKANKTLEKRVSKKVVQGVEGDQKSLSSKFIDVFDVNYDVSSRRSQMTKGKGDCQRFGNYYLLTQYVEN